MVFDVVCVVGGCVYGGECVDVNGEVLFFVCFVFVEMDVLYVCM